MEIQTYKNDIKLKNAFVKEVQKHRKQDMIHYYNRGSKFEYVINNNGCWLWNGARSSMGYGVTTKNNKYTLAHRLSYEKEYGEIPEGLFILHICDNPPCINPKHLKVGTAKENTQDALKKGRMAYGKRHGLAKLNDEIVKEIRKLGKTATIISLARKYKVDSKTISNVINKKIWTHV